MRSENDRPAAPPALELDPLTLDSELRNSVTRARKAPVAETGSVEEAPHSEVRRVTRPEMGAVAGDEGWAQKMAGMPVVVVPVDLLKRLPLDHRDGFLLSLMDGAIDLDTIVEISGIPRGEVIRLVRDLFESGVIDFRTPG
jgi:hypothetical protein